MRIGYWRKISTARWRCPDGTEIVHEREIRTWSIYVQVFGCGKVWLGDYPTMRAACEAHAAYRASLRAPGRQIDLYA